MYVKGGYSEYGNEYVENIVVYHWIFVPLPQEIIRFHDTQNAEVRRWSNRRRLLLRRF